MVQGPASNRHNLPARAELVQGRAVWPTPNSLPTPRADTNRLPDAAKWFTGQESKAIYLSTQGLKLASDHRETELTDKADIPRKSHPESCREALRFLDNF